MRENTKIPASDDAQRQLSKVPQITLIFWIIKIAATTFGETAGDAVTMTMQLGYALGTALFFTFFVVTVSAQIKAKSFHPFLYWLVVIATTTVGTTMADFADRSLGIGYVGGSLILFGILVFVLMLWRFTMGSVSVMHIVEPKVEIFYWVTILFSNTLGTALGDFLADDSGLGYEGGALVFAACLVCIAAAYFFTRISRTFLFWAAFILTRPLGATLGDMLTKPIANGGFNMSRATSSAIIAIFIFGMILFTTQKADSHPGREL